ncbi:VIT1/CCC1 transporter family protein [Rarobacter faecitabidus]|uniref:VIT1/CCC1 family predicted Fe2+/Mn2+ transporter n=1 Tax=Rarobacter faecitabidus TaxID=13243 RepID=A0A542ZB24_RARFA|nr:VIT1/CCC1 transporter family protein [Rarobacter faecitabidus]TQL57516.1 VIT1/CCC1 family predicted Fe2+/Mn2+ transporter [Rarobacter faecitabidus]
MTDPTEPTRSLIEPGASRSEPAASPSEASPARAGRADSPSRRQVRRWQRNLVDERIEAGVYVDLAAKVGGEEREILLALAEAERRHEAHWLELLGDHATNARRGFIRSHLLGFLARHFGGIFVLALAQKAEARAKYDDDLDATAQMAADEHIHEEVVRALAERGRTKLSGTFRAAVFGANDGLVSNLALILGVGAAGVSNQTVLLSGVAGLLAGAMSMGAGEYVSVRSQRELLEASTPSVTAAQRVPDLDVDANELALIYRAHGMSEADAQAQAEDVIANYSSSTRLGPAPDPADFEAHGTAWGAAISSFCFFASGALIPILPYLFGMTGLAAVVVATVLVGLALSLTGAAVGLLSGSPPLRRAVRQVLIGFGAAGVTYALGALFGVATG